MLQKELFDWIKETRSNFLRVSIKVWIQALRLAKKMKITYLKASSSWCWQFYKYHNLFIRKRAISQWHSDDHEDILTKYQTFFIKLRKKHDYPMDGECRPDAADIPAEMTVHMKGDCTVTMKTTGKDKNCFTVMLGLCLIEQSYQPISYWNASLCKNTNFHQESSCAFRRRIGLTRPQAGLAGSGLGSSTWGITATMCIARTWCFLLSHSVPSQTEAAG